jgi:hypothetical protein
MSLPEIVRRDNSLVARAALADKQAPKLSSKSRRADTADSAPQTPPVAVVAERSPDQLGVAATLVLWIAMSRRP